MGSAKSKRPVLARRVKFSRPHKAGKRPKAKVGDFVAAALAEWRFGHRHRRYKVKKTGSRRVAVAIRFSIEDGFFALDDLIETSMNIGLVCAVKLPKRGR